LGNLIGATEAELSAKEEEMIRLYRSNDPTGWNTIDGAKHQLMIEWRIVPLWNKSATPLNDQRLRGTNEAKP